MHPNIPCRRRIWQWKTWWRGIHSTRRGIGRPAARRSGRTQVSARHQPTLGKYAHYLSDTALSSGLVPVSPLLTLCGSDPSPGSRSTRRIRLPSSRLSLRQTMINRMYTWSLRSKTALYPRSWQQPADRAHKARSF